MWIAEYWSLGIKHERDFDTLPEAYGFLINGKDSGVISPFAIKRPNEDTPFIDETKLRNLIKCGVSSYDLIALLNNGEYSIDQLNPCPDCDKYKQEIADLKELNINQAAEFYRIMAHLMPTLCGMEEE